MADLNMNGLEVIVMGFLEELIKIVGTLTTVIAIILFFWAIVSWILGVYPLFYRLGFGRWKRKIAIVAIDEKYNFLKLDLIQTGIFRKKNIYQITKESLAELKDATLALIHYQSFDEEQIKTILSNKNASAGFIFYFPEFMPPTTVIPPAMMKAINNHQSTIIVNMRGRLINDIVTTLLSTSYDKK